jgi:hypothetical protein
MRLVDARNHRQGDGDQGSRLTVLSRRCVAEAAPTSLLSAMSAAERGADQHGKGAAYLIKPLFCTPRRGARVVVSNAGRMPLSCAAALRRARRTLHKALSRKRRKGSARLTRMSAKPQQLGPPNIGTPASTIPLGLRVLAMALRAVFIGALVVVTVRVSSPQSETFSSVYETPGDLIRLALGFAVCLWIVIHLFMLPKDAEGYRTWVYLGLVVVPLAVAVAFVLW